MHRCVVPLIRRHDAARIRSVEQSEREAGEQVGEMPMGDAEGEVRCNLQPTSLAVDCKVRQLLERAGPGFVTAVGTVQYLAAFDEPSEPPADQS